MKHVLITGGAGFIGSHLCDAFLAKGYAVTALDNFVTGSRTHLARALENPCFELTEWNVSRSVPEPRMHLLNEHGLHGVLHFARPSVFRNDAEGLGFEALSADSLGTMNTVELALRHDARFILASSSEVCASFLPEPENIALAVTQAGARFAETYVRLAMTGKKAHAGGPIVPLNGAIARIFSTYGPRMPSGTEESLPDSSRWTVGSLCARALTSGESLATDDIEGEGNFCYVTDLVRGIVSLFESRLRQSLDFRHPVETDLAQAKRLIDEILDLPREELVMEDIRPLPASDEPGTVVRPTFTRSFDWSPETQLREGLTRTLAYLLQADQGARVGTSISPAALLRRAAAASGSLSSATSS